MESPLGWPFFISSRKEPPLSNQLIVGWREWIALPELGLLALEAKIDTGAATSALHAVNINVGEEAGRPWVEFETQPLIAQHPTIRIRCKAPVVTTREVTSSSGHRETRIVIRADLRLGINLDAPVWPILVTLADRSAMQMPLLIGREALADRVLVASNLEATLGELETPEAFYS